ncbi:hypothetical protein ACRRTK_009649 [Alexandromys fortis]
MSLSPVTTAVHLTLGLLHPIHEVLSSLSWLNTGRDVRRPYANEEKALYLQQEKKLSLGFSDGTLAACGAQDFDGIKVFGDEPVPPSWTIGNRARICSRLTDHSHNHSRIRIFRPLSSSAQDLGQGPRLHDIISSPGLRHKLKGDYARFTAERIVMQPAHQSLTAPALDDTVMLIQVHLRTLASQGDTEQMKLCAGNFLDWTPRGSEPPNKPVGKKSRASLRPSTQPSTKPGTDDGQLRVSECEHMTKRMPECVRVSQTPALKRHKLADKYTIAPGGSSSRRHQDPSSTPNLSAQDATGNWWCNPPEAMMTRTGLVTAMDLKGHPSEAVTTGHSLEKEKCMKA